MVSQPPRSLNAHVGADGGELFAQKAHIDLHMVFHGVGIKAPHAREQNFFGEIVVAGLQQKTHYVKLLGG